MSAVSWPRISVADVSRKLGKALCGGYQVVSWFGPIPVCTYYAVLSSGDVLCSVLRYDSVNFDKKGRFWFPCDGVPGGAEWIGHYPAVRSSL